MTREGGIFSIKHLGPTLTHISTQLMKGPFWTYCQTSLSLQSGTKGMLRSCSWDGKTCPNGSCWKRANPFSPELCPCLQMRVYECSSASPVLLHHFHFLQLSDCLFFSFFFFWCPCFSKIDFAHLGFLDEEHKSICSFLCISFSFSSKTTICMCCLLNDWLVNVLLCPPKSPQMPYKPAQQPQTLLAEKIHDSFCELFKGISNLILWCVSVLENGE